MPGDLRVALLGYGPAGEAFHAPLIAATPGLALAAIVTREPERRARAHAAHPGAELLPRDEDVWARAASLDLVVIATPNRTHVPLAIAALEADLAVVVDKPFAATVADARRAVEVARRRGLLLTVFQNRRWDGDFLTVQRLRREDALGEVFRFESSFERWRPVPKAGWREHADPQEAGGALYDLGSHLIDQALVLFGPVQRAHTELDRRRPGVVVEDDVFLALTHTSGVRTHLWMSAAAAQSAPRFRVLGTRAAYVKYGLDVQEAALRAGGRPGTPGWGEEPQELWGRLGAGDDLRPVRTEAGAYLSFYIGVERALRDGTPPPVDPEDSITGLEIIESALMGTRA
ncbi:MAG TPA: Gfo/Idh/MocA family oxidoreductase [Gemmatimonadaceae bacterium]|nr:Gfo/Idh/MocA family oxidoreductase [Gemmatimonadaceae bacterium]